MEIEPVHVIRENTRNLLKFNRRMHKDQEVDTLRSLNEIRITTEDIELIAKKLKTKSAVTTEDLQILKNGLLNDSKNIEVFLNEHGALRGLVRELTGHNVDKQCLAAGCCCNLALGDTRACTAIAKAAGSYLVAALDNLTIELAVTCAWTLGNLAGGGSKVCNILTAQGAVSKLIDLQTNDNLQDTSLSALIHFAMQMKDDLKVDHLQKLLKTLSKLELSFNSLHLLFILSCHNEFSQNIPEELLENLLQSMKMAINSHKTCRQTDTICCKLVYIFRILANTDNKHKLIMNYFVNSNLFLDCKSVLDLNSLIINNSLLWLLGNLYKYCDDENLFLEVLS